MDEIRRLERMLGTLATHVAFGDATEAVVDESEEAIRRRGLACFHRAQDESDLALREAIVVGLGPCLTTGTRP